jgi:hypothetical protein
MKRARSALTSCPTPSSPPSQPWPRPARSSPRLVRSSESVESRGIIGGYVPCTPHGISALLPPSGAVLLSEVTVAQAYVLLHLTAMAPTTCCPRCAMPSSSVPSCDQRQLADLPWGSLAVRIRLPVRTFVCRFFTRLRRAAEAGQAPKAHTSPYTRRQGPAARAVSFTLICPAAKRSQAAQLYVEQLCQVDAGVARANQLIQAFLATARERRAMTSRRGWQKPRPAASLSSPGLHVDCRRTWPRSPPGSPASGAMARRKATSIA